MKKKNGFTLLELLICVTLLSVVILFLFRLINDVRSEGTKTNYIKEVYVARNEFMSGVGSITSTYGVCSINTSQSTSDEAIIRLSICNGKSLVIDVTSKKFGYTYDGEEYVYKIEDENTWIDTNFVMDSSTFVNYEYFEIVFKTHKKGVEDTNIDDIGIYYGMLRDEANPNTTSYVQDCTFDTDEECIITAPRTGTYKLELWGGKGTDAIGTSRGKHFDGGRGGYSYGEIHLEKGQTLYGGLALGAAANSEWGTDGGDGVFLALNKVGRGYLEDYINDKGQILIVAGGGGGAAKCDVHPEEDTADLVAPGRNAGGPKSSDGNWAGSFGHGDACPYDYYFCGASGGGGYYGGRATVTSFYACTEGWVAWSYRRGGGGGTGYLNTNYIKNAVMYAYNNTYTSDNIDDRTYNTSCKGYAVPKCGNDGLPYIKVTVSEYDE